jgi:outer membrane protein OmpA-like peptidoglycan-associated protein
MRAELKSGFIVCLVSLLCAGNAGAEEKNFGKSLPSKENIINEFKASPADAAEEVQTDEGTAVGKTRGLKKIGVGRTNANKPDGYHIPVQTSSAEKAISLEVLFDYNSDNLTADAKLQLVPVGGAMASEELKGLHYRIEGHTDVVGGDQYNIELSRRRAEAVKAFLIEQYGLAASAIEIVGKGKQDLADRDNPTSEANRRVRIVRLTN